MATDGAWPDDPGGAASGFRPAVVGLLARISHRNGRDPVGPDFKETHRIPSPGTDILKIQKQFAYFPQFRKNTPGND